MEIDLGITAGDTLTRDNDIFASPPSGPFDTIKIDMISATQDLVRGQVLKGTAAAGYAPVTNAADFVTNQAKALILLQSISQVASAAKAVAIGKGAFLQERLTPDDIPAGEYKSGNIIIREEVEV